MLKRFGASVGVVSALVLALYLQQPDNIARYSAPLFLWTLPAIALFWQAHVWLKVERGEMDDDPLLFALRDPVSWAAAAIAGAAFLAAALV